MSALDDAIDFLHSETHTQSDPDPSASARAELAALRAVVNAGDALCAAIFARDGDSTDQDYALDAYRMARGGLKP